MKEILLEKVRIILNLNISSIVYFMAEGVGGYVLPRFNNLVYIEIEKGDHFGLIDLVIDQDSAAITPDMIS
jgi:hypothetical protein